MREREEREREEREREGGGERRGVQQRKHTKVIA